MKKNFLGIILAVLCPFSSLIAQTTFLTQDFQGTGIPSGWSQTTVATDGGWKFGTNTALQSTYFQLPSHTKFACTNDDACNCDKSDDRLITSSLDLSTATAVLVSFDYYYLNLGESATLEVSVDNGANWSFVEILDASGPVIGYDTEWGTHVTDISAIAAGQSTVLISFKYNDEGIWGWGFCVDNLSVYQPVDNDAALTSVTPSAYSGAAVGDSIMIGGTIINYGATTITSCVINWSDGINTYPYTLTSNIPLTGSVTFTHSKAYHVTSNGSHTINVWVELNGDAIHDNDSVETVLLGYPFIPVHKVVVEDQTIAPSGFGIYCPRGIVYMDSMSRSDLSDNVELISVHSPGFDAPYDPMVNEVYSDGCFNNPNVTTNAWPQIMVDRKTVDDPANIFGQYESHASDFAVADIGVVLAYDSVTRALDVTAETHFAIAVTPTSGSYNLALVLTEDSVHNNDISYSQRNVYSGGALGPMSGGGIDFVEQPDPVPADIMYHRHVAREILSSFYGTDGSLPSTIDESGTYSYTFPTYTIPAEYNAKQMRAIVLLLDNNNGEIKNANGASILDVLTSVQQVGNIPGSFSVIPNPFSDETSLTINLAKTENVSVNISNLLNETLSVYDLGLMTAGEHTFVLNGKDIPSGIYLVTLNSDGGSVTKKVVVNK